MDIFPSNRILVKKASGELEPFDHEKVKKAKKGDSVGLKVSEKVREGYKVYKV